MYRYKRNTEEKIAVVRHHAYSQDDLHLLMHQIQGIVGKDTVVSVEVPVRMTAYAVNREDQFGHALDVSPSRPTVVRIKKPDSAEYRFSVDAEHALVIENRPSGIDEFTVILYDNKELTRFFHVVE